MTIPAGSWKLDSAHSSVGFSVKHLMVSKVRGTFKKFDGVAITGENLSTFALTAKVDAASLTTGDDGRDAHLRGEDFFDVETYPEILFEGTAVELTKDEDVVNLKGELTLHGVTRPVTFRVEIGGVAKDPYGNMKGAAEATTVIKRSDFGLTWNTALEAGGVLVSDEVTIFIDAQAVYEPKS
jgi:polyisoprenoid-binding protein YceI